MQNTAIKSPPFGSLKQVLVFGGKDSLYGARILQS